MKVTPSSVERRAFLKAAATGAAVGVFVVAATGTAEAKTVQQDENASEGYRETDHVRRYYASLRGE